MISQRKNFKFQKKKLSSSLKHKKLREKKIVDEPKLYCILDNCIYEIVKSKRKSLNEKDKCMNDDGNIYEGEWENNEQSGKGMMSFKNGDKYEGEWKHDVASGYGVYTHCDGTKHEGEWKKGFCAGHGTTIYKKGLKITGMWKHNDIDEKYDVIIRQENEKQELKYEYIGKIKDSDFSFFDSCQFKRHGKGVEKYQDGSEYHGEWKDDAKTGYGLLKKNNIKVLQYWKSKTLIDSVEVTTDCDFSLEDIKKLKIINNSDSIQGNDKTIELANASDFTETELADLECSITGFYKIKPVVLSCGHKFCKVSLENYHSTNMNGKSMKCMLCRNEISSGVYFSDVETNKLLQKCKFTIDNKPIDTESFIICYQFMNKWFHGRTISGLKSKNDSAWSNGIYFGDEDDETEDDETEDDETEDDDEDEDDDD